MACWTILRINDVPKTYLIEQDIVLSPLISKVHA